MSHGWIKIHRKIKSHWLFTDSKKFHAWIAILLEVNHQDKDIILGNKVFKCKAGESYKSLDSWSRTFGAGWSKSATRRFLALLKKEKIIDTANVKKTTHLTVCKWDTYQLERNDDETQVKRKRNASETQATPNKNEKEIIKNEKEINKRTSNIRAQAIERILKAFPKVVLHNDALVAIGNAIQREVDKGYSEDEVIITIDDAVKSYAKERKGEDSQFTKECTKWMNGGGYLAEYNNKRGKHGGDTGVFRNSQTNHQQVKQSPGF